MPSLSGWPSENTTWKTAITVSVEAMSEGEMVRLSYDGFEALAARHTTPYTGPDRRATRKTKVSVVVPANLSVQVSHYLLKRAGSDRSIKCM